MRRNHVIFSGQNATRLLRLLFTRHA